MLNIDIKNLINKPDKLKYLDYEFDHTHLLGYQKAPKPFSITSSKIKGDDDRYIIEVRDAKHKL